MVTKMVCDWCGNAIGFKEPIQVSILGPLQSYPYADITVHVPGKKVLEKDFCSWSCVRLFATEKMGEEK